MVGRERPGSVGIGMLGINVGKVGRIGELIGGVKIGRVGAPVELVTLGRLGILETPEKLGVGMLNTGTLGLEMLGRPLVMFGNIEAGLGKPEMLLPVIGRIGVFADVLVRLPTSRGLDGSVGLGAGGTTGGCAGGVSPEHSETVFGKPPIPLIIDVRSPGVGSTGGEGRESTGGGAREGGIGAEVGVVGRNGVRNGGNVAAGSAVTKTVSILQTSNTSLACLFN